MKNIPMEEKELKTKVDPDHCKKGIKKLLEQLIKENPNDPKRPDIQEENKTYNNLIKELDKEREIIPYYFEFILEKDKESWGEYMYEKGYCQAVDEYSVWDKGDDCTLELNVAKSKGVYKAFNKFKKLFINHMYERKNNG